MSTLLLTLLINGQIISQSINYQTIEACENAKNEFKSAYTLNAQDGYQMFNKDVANVSIVSSICTDLNSGSVF